ncbi:MAG TPA: ATP-binding protein, partial [Ktedonobacterales bacterium]|nr:ATP-binding protein [Ktedonobacterales bacterium]
LAIWWLRVAIPPMGVRVTYKQTYWQRLRNTLSNPVTWKSLAYLMAKFPLGIFTFIAVLVLITLSAGLILAPVAYLLNTYIYHVTGLQAPSYTISPFGIVTIDGTFRAGSFWKVLATAPFGIIGGAISLHLCNGMAWLWGQFSRLMLGMSDVERRLAEARAVAAQEHARAQRSEQSRRELIVNVGHDLRTPIASIRGHVESLLMATEGEANEQIDQETLQSYLTIVNRETERLGTLVDDLLVLARADASELRLDIAPVAAGEVVEEVYQALAHIAQRERQVTVIRQIAPDVPPVWADRQRLGQVLQNLVRNAITYTPAGGIVSISLARAGDAYVELAVSDTGEGIAPEQLPYVFERFYRTDASRTRASGGFGLGLAIARDLVQAMGGTITATSTVNEGSRFSVMLHVAPPQSSLD